MATSEIIIVLAVSCISHELRNVHTIKAVFHWAEFSARSDIFSSKISAMNFDLISTSILPKAKMVRKRRNKMKRSAPCTHCTAKKTYSKTKAKILEKILGQTEGRTE